MQLRSVQRTDSHCLLRVPQTKCFYNELERLSGFRLNMPSIAIAVSGEQPNDAEALVILQLLGLVPRLAIQSRTTTQPAAATRHCRAKAQPAIV